jgi:serine phosphatase RsbU (regulator of sigma subunit)
METSLQLAPGDRVVFYTDGIVEAMNDKNEMFGFERFLALVGRSAPMSANALHERILKSVGDFAGNTPQHDDLTVIVVSVEPKIIR